MILIPNHELESIQYFKNIITNTETLLSTHLPESIHVKLNYCLLVMVTTLLIEQKTLKFDIAELLKSRFSDGQIKRGILT